MSALKIFISYSWKDKIDGVMKSITNKLRQHNWDIWVDIYNLSYGDNINPSVAEAIQGVDLVLFMWSENFAASAGCQFEVQTVFEMNKPFVPCLISTYPLSKSLYFSGTKAYDFITPIKNISGFDWGWTQLQQHLLDLEADLLGDKNLKEEVKNIHTVTHEMEDTIYRMRQNASGNDSSDPFIQSMMMMAKMMAQNDPEQRPRYMLFFDGIQSISAMHPTQSEDAIKKQKMIHLINRIDPDGDMLRLQQLKAMTIASFRQP